MIFTITSLPVECRLVVEKIDVLRKQIKYVTSDNRKRWTGWLRRTTFARGIRGSNSIEGYNVSPQDAVAAVDEEEPMDAQKEAWLAVIGYRKAMSYVLQLANDPYFEYHEGMLRSLHYMMVDFDITKNPGRWRPGPIWVTNEETGQTVYEGPDVTLVPPLMKELITSLNAKNDLPVIVRGALAHLNLVMTHPFSDGNGRMARALQTMVLAREGVLDPTFSSIEEYLGRYTLDYYNVLAEVGQGAWHPERDSLPFIRFCLKAHYVQAETLLRRTKEIVRLWEILESEIKKRKLNSRMISALADVAYGYPVRNSSYRKMADVSDEVARKDLRALADQQLLIPAGERRGRHYIACDWLKAARDLAREKDVTTDPFIEENKDQLLLPGLPS